jgi:hypothetical protein
MPPAPDFGRAEHATSTAHVSEGTLARSVSTTTLDTRNTRNCTTSTPGLSRGLFTSIFVHCISLTVVLVDLSVNKANKISTNRSSENLRKSSSICLGSILGIENSN